MVATSNGTFGHGVGHVLSRKSVLDIPGTDSDSSAETVAGIFDWNSIGFDYTSSNKEDLIRTSKTIKHIIGPVANNFELETHFGSSEHAPYTLSPSPVEFKDSINVPAHWGLATASSATFVYGTFIGHISSGSDALGIFSAAAADLSGKTVAGTFYWDTRSSDYTTYSVSGDQINASNANKSGLIAISETINGITHTFIDDSASQITFGLSGNSPYSFLIATTGTADHANLSFLNENFADPSLGLSQSFSFANVEAGADLGQIGTGSFSTTTTFFIDSFSSINTLNYVPSPSPLMLADMSKAAYNDPSTQGAVDGYKFLEAVTDTTGGSGLQADAFEQGNEIVIAFRGTVITNVYNLIADASWLLNFSTTSLAAEVGQAVNFLVDIVTKNAGANITLTGHSLGGAIAQLLGTSTNYRSVTFNAPGPGAFVDDADLVAFLQLAQQHGTTGSPNILNYANDGDLVSTFGTQLGGTVTLDTKAIVNPNLIQINPAEYDLEEHSIATVISAMERATPVACFRRGTLILTDRGEVAVEELAIGDRVVTLSGQARPIKWIGRRSYEARFIRGKRSVLPVRITAGALGDGLPASDLWVSPEHALYLDGALVPARLLVNDSTVLQPEATQAVEYFHVELETHDIIIAEGTPAESYVECDNRAVFHNAAEFAALYPDDPRQSGQFCAQRLDVDAPGPSDILLVTTV